MPRSAIIKTKTSATSYQTLTAVHPFTTNISMLLKQALAAAILGAGRFVGANTLDVPLPKEGDMASLRGYNIRYTATQYKPFCGMLDDDVNSRHGVRLDIGTQCASALDAHLANTVDRVTIHGIDGAQIPAGKVADGYETCLCFTLKDSTPNTDKYGALCVWSDSKGIAEAHHNVTLQGNIMTSSYALAPEGKALPYCAATATGANETTTPPTSGGPNTSLVAGSSVGGVVVFIIIGLLVCCCCCAPREEVYVVRRIY
jgi:hypothetical protein